MADKQNTDKNGKVVKKDDETKKMTPMKKAFSIASTAILTVMFVVVIVIVFSVIIQAATNKTPNVLGYKFYTILTDSMTPTLEQRDLIISKVLKHKAEGSEEDANLVAEQIKEGDVVTFVGEYGAQSGMTITHRVKQGVHWDEEYKRYVITTQGDKQGATVDLPIPVENVVAVMVRKADFFKDIYNFFTSSRGIASMISVPLGLMLLSMILRFGLSIKLKIDEKKSPEKKKVAITSKESVQSIAQKAVEEYIKQQAIEEYKAMIAKQEKEKAEQAAKEQQQKAEEEKEAIRRQAIEEYKAQLIEQSKIEDNNDNKE